MVLRLAVESSMRLHIAKLDVASRRRVSASSLINLVEGVLVFNTCNIMLSLDHVSKSDVPRVLLGRLFGVDRAIDRVSDITVTIFIQLAILRHLITFIEADLSVIARGAWVAETVIQVILRGRWWSGDRIDDLLDYGWSCGHRGSFGSNLWKGGFKGVVKRLQFG